MSDSVQKRLIIPLYATIFTFMMTTVLNKEFYGKEDWLEWSLMFSLAWGIGCFIRKSIGSSEVKFWDYFFDTLVLKSVIIISSFIAIAFITSIVLELPNWYTILVYISGAFSVSLLLK